MTNNVVTHNVLNNAALLQDNTILLQQDSVSHVESAHAEVSGVSMTQQHDMAECCSEPYPYSEPYSLCKVNVRSHPKLNVRIGHVRGMCPVDGSGSTSTAGIADTGAQSNVWGMKDYLEAGFTQSNLQTVKLNLTAANKESIPISGGFLAHIEGDRPNGEIIDCKAMIYVSEAVSGLFLSLDTLILLRVVCEHFPVIGPCGECDAVHGSSNAISSSEFTREVNLGCINNPCDCPVRSSVPNRPKSLPFEPTPDNIPLMKKWLLDHFSSSTFNTCPHQPLQEMNGPPIEIHMDPDATPRVCHTPSRIPLHWQDQVEQDIKRDVALGILEKVPYGEPVTWCHRMVVTRKHDGKPRRTVDLSPLNKFCRRETYAAESPFHLARRVPPKVWKTVCDAWNGFHSVPLRESDRHLTTFITPFGRYRYTRAPQGFLSSGDGYNRRFAAILEGFQQMERCIDDTVFYDKSLEGHWWRTIDFLIRVGSAGIVLNPEKFQFSQKEVTFAGFKVTKDTVEPLPKYINAIKLFPTPQSSTDIRSWFGLVNQLASYAQLREIMEPFRPFLSSKVKFYWDNRLDQAFIRSKEEIVKLIRHGVQIFEMDKPVCLRSDWSKKGIGYVLLQKHCNCNDKILRLRCCNDGWKVVLAGSRFLSDTETRYAAIEGEALAIVYGLEQTRYFTQGCDNLHVVTDHKPLVKVFSDRTLDAITNTRLFRLKERTLQWRFNISYSPGKTNFAADATSRHPWFYHSVNCLSVGDLYERLTISSIRSEAAVVTSISWDILAAETGKDSVLSELCRAILGDFQGVYKGLTSYLRYKDALYIQDGVVMYRDRAVIPKSLRKTVLDTLHAAHQGISSMQLRAQAIAFWPGMTHDIAAKRNGCQECNRNAPSQAALPSEPSDPPSCPFEQVFADFCDFGGNHYLVAGDRLSGFTEVFQTPSGTSSSGARGLVKCLRRWFATFGVPRQLSSDGGPEFAAEYTCNFLKSWGVTHRISSAYNPSSNGRAEVAVKSVKRLMRSNLGPFGSLDTDQFLRAMLQMRNTPDPDCGVSPSQIVFGRPLRDNLLFTDYVDRGKYSKRWQDAWSAKEEALRARFIRTSEKINLHSKHLPPLTVGEKCFVQNQTGPHAKKWYHTGTVMEVLPHHKYAVKMDGSGRITCRNRRFLKVYTPVSLTMKNRSFLLPDVQTTPAKVNMGTDSDIGVSLDHKIRGSSFPDTLFSSHDGCGSPAVVGSTPNDSCDSTLESQQFVPPLIERPRQGRSPNGLSTPTVYSSQPSTSATPIRNAPTDSIPTTQPRLSPISPNTRPKPMPRHKTKLALRRLADFNAPGLKELGG